MIYENEATGAAFFWRTAGVGVWVAPPPAPAELKLDDIDDEGEPKTSL